MILHGMVYNNFCNFFCYKKIKMISRLVLKNCEDELQKKGCTNVRLIKENIMEK